MNTDFLFESIEKHINLSESEKEVITSLLQERKVKKNRFVVHEGSIDRCTYFVNRGSLITYFIDLEGKQHIVQFAIEGWWISDLQSFLMQVPAAFNVQALEESHILELPFEQLELLYKKVPGMERYFRIATQRAFISFQQRMVQNLSMDAEARYLAFQKKYPKIELRFPQKMVAEYLGISPEFLSKIKKRIAENNGLGKLKK